MIMQEQHNTDTMIDLNSIKLHTNHISSRPRKRSLFAMSLVKTDQDTSTIIDEVDREFINYQDKAVNVSPRDGRKVRDIVEDVQLYKLNFFQATIGKSVI
ncbi:hypothetical protein AKO1_001695 [Acrasis kona]|uniref:Uncharacterized protein n=1 Tax=Acrasis kona TaxID=1008807 RepID=A0AAW2Z955_9EUKA